MDSNRPTGYQNFLLDPRMSSKARKAELRAIIRSYFAYQAERRRQWAQAEMEIRVAQIPICRIVDDMLREAFIKRPKQSHEERNESLRGKRILKIDVPVEIDGVKVYLVSTTSLQVEFATVLTYDLLMDTFSVRAEGDWLVINSITRKKE